MRIALIAMAGAAALGMATPVCAQTGPQLAPGEILLHIGAQGSVPADYATLDISVAGQGASKEEAEAARAQIERDMLAALAEAGVGRSNVVLGEAEYSEYEDYDYSAVASEDAAEAAAAAVEEAALDVACDDSCGLTPVTRWNASSTMGVTVNDVTKLGSVTDLAATAAYDSSTQPVFGYRDEAKSKRAAITAAIAQARADAEAYADALGYRVVRIVAVGNDSAETSFPGFLQAMMALDTAGRGWTLLGQKTAPVTVDFVIAPQ